MKITNKDRVTLPISYTGYSKSKRYRVSIYPSKSTENIVFTCCSDIKDLRSVVDSHIEDLSQEEDFQIILKLDSGSGAEISYIDVIVTVTFEETKNLFYPPQTVNIYTKNGTFIIEATEEVHITLAFSAVLNIEDYPTKILEVLDGLIDKERASCPEMPIFVLLIAFDDELDMFEAFPFSITVKFYPNEKKSDSTQAQRVLQFNNFIDQLAKGEVLLEEKISKKRW